MRESSLPARAWTLLIPALAAFLVVPARAGVVYDTFGSDNSYNWNEGLGIGPSAGVRGRANSFVPSATGTLDRIDMVVGLWYGQDPGEIDILIMSDDNNKPSTVLEAIPYSLTSLSGYRTFYSSSHPELVAGTQYWLGVWSYSSYLTWNFSSFATGLDSQYTTNASDWWRTTFPSRVGAFRITDVGSPVPEPGAGLLFLAGAAVLAAAGRVVRRN